MDFEQENAKMNGTEYKKYHESFMQNNHGSSAPHVFFCIFFTVQCSIYSSIKLRNCKSNQYVYEYLIIVLPLIMIHTILSNYVFLSNFIIMIMWLYEFYQCPKNISSSFQPAVTSKIFSISIMRGLTYLITVYAILAVDFRDFPRHLAKTERYGYSLMDTGVGLFVLMSGLVHKDLQKHNIIDILKGNLKFITILIFLGVARYVSVKQLDYQEHVTEYGVHWNFFFTLAVCKFLSTFILHIKINKLLCSFILLFTHELVLSSGVQKWVFSDAIRDTLVSANREGISSALGYVSLYVFGSHIKYLLTSNIAPLKLNILNYISFNMNEVQMVLFYESSFLWSLLYVINKSKPISRTLANASYCVFLEATLVTVVTILYYIDRALQSEKSSLKAPKIIESVNSSGLSYFLAANLMTGAINLTIRTLFVSSITTFYILNVYMILALVLTVFVRKIGIKI